MSYLHIQNLYRDQTILMFRECYALEKVHGTSAHLSYSIDLANPPATPQLSFFAGGESHTRFVALFDQPALLAGFAELGHNKITVYGEAYGGKCQGMKSTYGDELRFIAFDVKIGDSWLSVPNMHDVCSKLGIEVVPWRLVHTDLATLDGERDRPSEVAVLRGCGPDKMREGVVLRPLVEMTTNDGSRVICKHKGEKFSERATPQTVTDPAKLQVLSEANALCEEWCTENRLSNILSHLPNDIDVESTKLVIDAMVADVYREGAGEVVESREATAAIGRKAVKMFRDRLKDRVKSAQQASTERETI